MRERKLNSILTELNTSSADIQASAVISTDGLILTSLMPSTMPEDRVAAMVAAMLSLGERTSEELGRGELEQVLVKGVEGYILMTSAGLNTVLTVVTRASAKLGMIFWNVRMAADSIRKII
jgi:predicted regulator of Ras-like GTPase activity (Roadblock/LC7/MglB family)